ncbi:NADPH:quinone reductase [Burkholderia sp. YR290]|nr:NADPH:quinone reductase [Burkholderia sp. YR290]
MEAIRIAAPKPDSDHVIIRVVASSLNPLEFTGADRDFLSCTPAVVPGFDVSGIVVAVGSAVRSFSVGDEVVAIADLNGNESWSTEGGEVFANARFFLTAAKPKNVSFQNAAALPLCLLSAFASIHQNVMKGDNVYIPGGGGGVALLAVQIATRIRGAAIVISSGSTAQSIELARTAGAHHVYSHSQPDIASEIARLTNGKGVDVVCDMTYSESSFVQTAKTIRTGGKWIELGGRPRKTMRRAQPDSPVESILRAKNASYINVNILRYFTDPTMLSDRAKLFLHYGLTLSMEWVERGLLAPHLGETTISSMKAITAELALMRRGADTTA